MRVVSWNCNGALRKKRHLLDELQADVIIAQECENPAQTQYPDYKQWAGNYLWIGENKHKGIGVFVKSGMRLEPIDLDAGQLQLFLPCRVDGITVLAVWTKDAGSPTFKYIGQFYKWLQLHKVQLAKNRVIVIGDLNSNARWDVWDRWWNHSDVVKELSDIGLHSLYHAQTGQGQGSEIQPTFFLHRKLEKSYHIDYAFLSERLMAGAHLSVGAIEHWLAHSDHLPLIVDLVPSYWTKPNKLA